MTRDAARRRDWLDPFYWWVVLLERIGVLKSDGPSEKPGTGARLAGDHRAHPVQKRPTAEARATAREVGTGSPVSASRSDDPDWWHSNV